ncbi:MAG: ectoine synthase [Sphingomonadales bacterium]|nr:MAG: ectoine synthase [Sphingomonadales bacterium]
MIIRDLNTIRNSDKNVKSEGWVSARMLLRDDDMGFSFHVTTMFAGAELHMHYQNHLEAVLVMRGEGTIENLDTGEVHALKSGVMYALNENDRHIVRPTTDLLTACVFNPPVSGNEVHDENGAYPAAALGYPLAH